MAVYRDSFYSFYSVYVFTDVSTNAKVNTRSGNVACFLFDSYCRNSRGIIDGEPSFLVIINFDGFFQVETYIGEAHQLSSRAYPPHF